MYKRREMLMLRAHGIDSCGKLLRAWYKMNYSIYVHKGQFGMKYNLKLKVGNVD